jgi:cytochrome b
MSAGAVGDSGGEVRVKLWDLPVRICHWSFALLLPAMWWTAEYGEMGWHKRLGLVLLALLAFRIIWGFIGSSTARFASFVRGPGAVIAYLRSLGGKQAPKIGHNPVGGWSALAMLAAMLAQVGMGLFAGDPYDGATGPLNGLVRTMTADRLTDWHEDFFNVLVALVVLHLLAVAFYLLVKRENLLRPMITGSRTVLAGAAGMEPVPAWRAVVAIAASVLLAGWVWSGAPPL